MGAIRARILVMVGCLAAVPAWPAQWPEHAVHLIVPSPPGSSIDYAARLYGEHLSARWKQPVVVENRPGADGVLAVQALLAAKDGHTLLLAFPGIVTVVPLLHERLPYDATRDLEPLAAIAGDFLGIVVPMALPVKNLNELAALARKRPGALNWAASPGAPYLAFREFEKRAGVQLVAIQYRSGPSALPDLIAGQVQVAVVPLAAALPQAANGKLRVLASTGSERLPAARDIPTAKEAGYPELTIDAPLGLFAAKGFPNDAKARVSTDVLEIANLPDVDSRLSRLGMSAKAVNAAQYVAFLQEQQVYWARLAKAHGGAPNRK